MSTRVAVSEAFERLEVLDVKARVGDLFREDRWVRWVASHSLPRVVDFVIHADVENSGIESTVFVVELLALFFIVRSLCFVDEERVGLFSGVGLLRLCFLWFDRPRLHRPSCFCVDRDI